MSQSNQAKPFTLAKPWILPFIIVSGLAAAWAAPWTFGDASYLQISKIIVPLVIQSALSAVTAILAFLGKPAWLGLLVGTFSLALVNGFSFSVGLWGAKLPTTQNIVLLITSIALIPTFIWGRKQVNYQVVSDVPTWNAENPHSDW
jgi:hypothetical protein